MQKIVLLLLVLSLIFLTLISLNAHHFLALYYVVWVGGIGSFIWKNRQQIEDVLAAWKVRRFQKFLFLGVIMVLLEETFAGISMHLATSRDIHYLIVGVLQFWTFNLLALPGFIIAWYLLLVRFYYTRKEVFVLVGLFGLFAESVGAKIIANPIAGAALILPTMFSYVIIITPSVMSFRKNEEGKQLPPSLRYMLGCIVPIIVSLPFIYILSILKIHFPDMFPPFGFVQ